MATTFQVAKNRAKSALAADITDTATSLTVTAGEGTKFPSTYPFPITIEDEILKCTNRSTDTLTVERAQEGTAAAAHASGKFVHLRITAKFTSDLHTAVNTIENKPAFGRLDGWTADRLLKGAGASVNPTEVSLDACACKRTTVFSVATATWTEVPWNDADTEEFDTNNMHDINTNPSRITVQVAGKYLVFGYVKWAENATGSRYIRVLLNGTTEICSIFLAKDSGGRWYAPITTVNQMAVGNYLELMGYQNSGAALNVEAESRFGILLLAN